MLRSVGGRIGRRGLASAEVAKSGPSGLAVPTAEVKLTRMPNQMMVTSVQTSDVGGTTVSMAFKAGSRYEAPGQKGCAHRFALMARFGTGANAKLTTEHRLYSAGVELSVNQNRDLIVLTGQTRPEHKKEALKVMADIVSEPGFRANEIYQAGQDALLMAAQKRNADPRLVLDDLVHKAAYGDSGLGAPLYASPEAVNSMDLDALRGFFQDHFVSGGTALVGVNVDHDYLVDYSADALPLAEESAPPPPPAQGYLGGQESKPWGGDIGRAIWAVEGASWQDAKGLAAQAVLLQLLVGDVSAPWASSGHGSVAGPALQAALGSSAFTLQPYQAAHSDSGLVGFHLAVRKTELQKALSTVLASLKGLASNAPDLEGAKKRAAMQLLSDLEGGDSLVQISAAQVLSGPNFATPADMGDAVAAVTAADVAALATKLSSAKASLASLGDPAHTPRLENL